MKSSPKYLKIRKYINTNNEPYYISRDEYEAQLHSKTESPNKIYFRAFLDPELTVPALKWGKPLKISLLDAILKQIEE